MEVSLSERITKLQNRLARIEGQVRGIASMIEQGRSCIDVLTQIQAARGALMRVEAELLRVHIGECARAALAGGSDDTKHAMTEELVRLLQRRIT